MDITRGSFLRVFIGIMALLVVVDFIIPKKPYFGWDGIPGFFALFGLFGCFISVLVAKIIRFMLVREEEYYND